ncbi:hypothetical protein CGI49_20170 [Vibrio parahaemolyticus]|nr:hypothetical protein CGI65_10515 [Vibrio parahaemolyticus]TOI96911.1 hypothetical protein CGI49_20170 [Vibrio parahaemolyticus]
MVLSTSSDPSFLILAFTLPQDNDSFFTTIQSCLNVIASLATILAIPVAIFIFLQWKKQRLSNRLFESLLELMELSTLLRYCCVDTVYSVIASDIHQQNPNLRKRYAEDTFEKNNYLQYRMKTFEVLSSLIARVDVKYALAKNLKSRPKYLNSVLKIISKHINISHMSYCRVHCEFLSPDQEDSVIHLELTDLPKDHIFLTELKKQYLDNNLTITVQNGEINGVLVVNSYSDLWDKTGELTKFLFSFYSEQLVYVLSNKLNNA